MEVSKIWRERELQEAEREPSLVDIPRFFVPQKKHPAERAATDGPLKMELARIARSRLREHMTSLILVPADLEQLWRQLKLHASPPLDPADERINYDDFSQVAETMPPHCARSLFCASHFIKFFPDGHGRISILDFFQWARRKNSLMMTRAELSSFDAAGDGTMTEREIEQWIDSLIPTLPALSGIVQEFFPFYKVTAVRKFLFFLDPRHRGRVPIKAILKSPVTHELLELRRHDITQEELRHNWFSLAYAEMLYADYLELDEDQNGCAALSMSMACPPLRSSRGPRPRFSRSAPDPTLSPPQHALRARATALPRWRPDHCIHQPHLPGPPRRRPSARCTHPRICLVPTSGALAVKSAPHSHPELGHHMDCARRSARPTATSTRASPRSTTSPTWTLSWRRPTRVPRRL